MAKPDTTAMLAEFDALVEINGRLMFAKANYNEGEAEAFGIRLLEFFNRHAIDLRAAITTAQVTASPQCEAGAEPPGLGSAVHRLLDWQPLTHLNKGDRLWQILEHAGLPADDQPAAIAAVIDGGTA